MLLTECDLYRQLKIETIKEEKNNISEMSVKEKQLRTHGKLENLKFQLLRLVGDLQETVTYNPFKGTNQALMQVEGSLLKYGTDFVTSEPQVDPNAGDGIDPEEAQKRRL